MSEKPACRSCGRQRDLGKDGQCRNKAACLRRVTKTMVTKPYIGGFDPVKAYWDAPKGDA